MIESRLLPHRDPVPLERWFAERGVPPVLDLGRSGAASLSVGELLAFRAAADCELRDLSLDYGDGRGGAALRQSLCRAGAARHPDEIIVTHGATEALLLTIRALCRHGDEVTVATPAYGGLLGIPRSVGCQVTQVPVWEDRRRHLDLAPLHACLDAGSRLVVVNTPQNPTGAVAAVSDLELLVEHAGRTGAHVVVDEVALGTIDCRAGSAIALDSFGTGAVVVISDISKGLGLGGLRIGWLATADRRLRDAAASGKDASTISNAGPAEMLGRLAVDHADELRGRARAHVRRNLVSAESALGDRLVPPFDGLVALVRVGGDDARFAEKLRRRHDVAVVPGKLFSLPGYVRIGLGIAPHHFEEAVCHLEAELRSWPV